MYRLPQKKPSEKNPNLVIISFVHAVYVIMIIIINTNVYVYLGLKTHTRAHSYSCLYYTVIGIVL
jgi:hypothetical protein